MWYLTLTYEAVRIERNHLPIDLMASQSSLFLRCSITCCLICLELSTPLLLIIDIACPSGHMGDMT